MPFAIVGGVVLWVLFLASPPILLAQVKASVARNETRRARLLLRLLRLHPFPPGDMTVFEVHALVALGDPESRQRAIELLRLLFYSWKNANDLVNEFIRHGHYEEALLYECSFNPDYVEDAREVQDSNYVLVQINLAEAEYNLGRWDAAWKRLEPLDEICEATPILRGGLLLQRGWIASHRGRSTEALTMMETVSPRDFPPIWRAEIYFARAFAFLQVGRISAARQHVRKGAAMSKRPSSFRNALYLHGQLSAAEGNLEEASEYFRRGAGHPFQGQGGDGLLHWGDCLAALERPEDAAHAWKLAIERDPQSESATRAKERIQVGVAPPSANSFRL